MDLRPGERLDDLGRGGLQIIQHPGRFPFAMDPVLLAAFTRVRHHDSVLDLGTGSGVIPLLLASRHPEAQITGLELQAETADMARRSVVLNRLDERIQIDCGDYRAIRELYRAGQFDVVTMNPPYREVGRGRTSPQAVRALSRHEGAGTLDDALQAAAFAVKPKGRVAVVFLAERLPDLFVQMHSYRIEPKRLRFVQGRIDQPPKLALVEAVKGGGVGLQVDPVLVVYAHDRNYTAEMAAIYGDDMAPA